EREKIEEEYQETLKAIEEYKAILADEMRILQIIKEELTAVKEKYGDERRTQIVVDTSEIDVEDLIAEEDVVITLTHGGYIKRISLDTYRKQKRGGRGVTGMGTKEADFVENLLVTTTHHTILFFTSRGRVYYLKAYEIAESNRQAKGTAIINLLQLDKDEKITAVIQVKEFDPERYLFMATRKGIVKKTQLSEFSSMRKGGLIAVNLDEDDDLIGVKFTDGESYLMLATREGISIAFSEDDVRAMGRVARGVRGIRLREGDEVIGMDILSRNAELLTVTEGGYGKRTPTSEYRSQTRGGKGLINMKVTEKTGKVIGIKVVHEDQELILITTEGIVIRTNVSDISVIGRNTQGVLLIKTDSNDKVASMAAIDQKSE
ncbi:MAG: DNA gyrase subunit A, partial [Selenomonadaceae bacterium]|nr:DNA gyrase subunit A [Selenomonadaceae bacterium]